MYSPLDPFNLNREKEDKAEFSTRMKPQSKNITNQKKRGFDFDLIF